MGHQLWKETKARRARAQLSSRVDALSLLEFANPCHDEHSGRFCDIHGEVHGGVTPEEHKVLAGVHPDLKPAVSEILADRRIAEPEMTKIVEDVSKEFGGSPIGLDFRHKTASGVIDKIARKVKDKGISAEQAAAGISDALRYTMGFPPEKYVEGFKASVAALVKAGFRFDGPIENNWDRTGSKQDAYQGINAVVIHPTTGLKVEIQWHTPRSFEVKDKLQHKDYEYVREHKGTSGTRLQAWERMRANATSIPEPPGVRDIPSSVAGVTVKHVYRPNTETLSLGGESWRIRFKSIQ